MQLPKKTPKEIRVERKNKKCIEDLERKARLMARLNIDPVGPRIQTTPDVSAAKPRAIIDPDIIWTMKMTWCASIADTDGAWSWREERQWTDNEFTNHISKTLNSLAQSTWHDIHQMRSGGLSSHHEQELSTIVNEAQDRWMQLDIQSDMTFRFRLTGKQRAWGVREGPHFKLVWYDRNHSIYPVGK